METLKVLKELREKRKSKSDVKFTENRLVKEIEKLADNYLVESSDILEFEVNKQELPIVMDIIDSPALSTKYNIIQKDKTIFCISLKEISI